MCSAFRLFWLFVFCSLTASGQTPQLDWARQASAQAAARGMARTPTGSYVVAGHFTGTFPTATAPLLSFGQTDALLLCYDARGQVRWSRQMGGPGRDAATAVAADSAGNLYVVGSFQGTARFGAAVLTSTGADDVFLAKYDSLGTLRWVQQGSGPQAAAASGVAVDPAGGVVLTGWFQDQLTLGGITLAGTGPTPGFVAEYDAQGTLRWARALPGSIAAAPAIGLNGRRYVAGQLAPGGSLLACLDAAGNPLWASAAAGGATATSVAAAPDGAVYVGGLYRDSLRVGPQRARSQGGYDGFLAKFDATGAGQWVRSLGGPGEDAVRAVALAGPASVAATGYAHDGAWLGEQAVSTGPACTTAFLTSFSTGSGTLRWAVSGTGTQSAVATGVAFDPTGQEGCASGGFYGTLTFPPTPTLQPACAGDLFAVHCTLGLTDLVVSSPQSVWGSYRNITVTGTGVATLLGPLSATGSVAVQRGGALDLNRQLLTGPGSFALAAGAELRTAAPDGLAATGTTGSVRLTGGRTFSPEATYAYSGSGPQVSGAGLPATVRALVVDNSAGLTLSAPVAVARLLRLQQGNLTVLNGGLTLLSSATGTALVDNTGGRVLGQVTVQRYLSPAVNSAVGYRHLASPVRDASVRDLSTGSFMPVVNPAYNTSSAPTGTVPYPTVLGYDQARLSTSPATSLAAFDKGWFSPAALTDVLQPAHGYSVHLAPQTVDFVGELTTGPVSRTLGRGPQTDAGWQLLGNPYPAPLDWRRVALPPGLDDALYVYRSTGPYAGQYRSYLNGIGDPILPLGQGFMVRTNTPAQSVQLTFTDAARLTDFDSTTTVYRAAAAIRPLLHLSLDDAQGVGLDETIVYFENGATTGTDTRFDALKAPSTPAARGQLVTHTAAGDAAAINGLPPLTAPAAVPLSVWAQRPGTYTLRLTQQPPATMVELLDKQTGRTSVLQPATTYRITVDSPTQQPYQLLLRISPTGTSATR